MQIVRFVSNLMESNMYVVREGRHALVIDPFNMEELEMNVVVDMVIATHEHYDHISGVNYWKEKTGAPFVCSSTCASRCDSPSKNLSRYFTSFAGMQEMFSVEEDLVVHDYTCEADLTFDEKMLFAWHGHNIEMIECPGHSPGSIVIVIDGLHIFVGDSLLPGFSTALRFPGGSDSDWRGIGLPLLRSFSRSATAYPGHFRAFKLSEHALMREA